QKLCALTGKIIHALFADVLAEAPVRARLERNRTRLGANFKEVVAYLHLDAMQKKKKGRAKAKPTPKSKAVANGTAGRKGKADPKSHAIVADDETDDEIEDVDAEDEIVVRQGEPLDEDEPEAEAEEAVDGAEADAESVLGD
ncbi:cohesin complex subunit, partial [Teratosphaeriaceae sp. CCFEE 6253]